MEKGKIYKPMNSKPYDYEAIFFDVGQGDVSLIRQIETDQSVLIDAKNGQKVCDFLKRHPKLKAIFVTHLDKDHIEGLPEIIGWLRSDREEKIKVFINIQNDDTKIAKKFKRALKAGYNEGAIEIETAFNEKDSIKKIKKEAYGNRLIQNFLKQIYLNIRITEANLKKGKTIGLPKILFQTWRQNI